MDVKIRNIPASIDLDITKEDKTEIGSQFTTLQWLAICRFIGLKISNKNKSKSGICSMISIHLMSIGQNVQWLRREIIRYDEEFTKKQRSLNQSLLGDSTNNESSVTNTNKASKTQIPTTTAQIPPLTPSLSNVSISTISPNMDEIDTRVDFILSVAFPLQNQATILYKDKLVKLMQTGKADDLVTHWDIALSDFIESKGRIVTERNYICIHSIEDEWCGRLKQTLGIEKADILKHICLKSTLLKRTGNYESVKSKTCACSRDYTAPCLVRIPLTALKLMQIMSKTDLKKCIAVLILKGWCNPPVKRECFPKQTQQSPITEDKVEIMTEQATNMLGILDANDTSKQHTITHMISMFKRRRSTLDFFWDGRRNSLGVVQPTDTSTIIESDECKDQEKDDSSNVYRIPVRVTQEINALNSERLKCVKQQIAIKATVEKLKADTTANHQRLNEQMMEMMTWIKKEFATVHQSLNNIQSNHQRAVQIMNRNAQSGHNYDDNTTDASSEPTFNKQQQTKEAHLPSISQQQAPNIEEHPLQGQVTKIVYKKGYGIINNNLFFHKSHVANDKWKLLRENDFVTYYEAWDNVKKKKHANNITIDGLAQLLCVTCKKRHKGECRRKERSKSSPPRAKNKNKNMNHPQNTPTNNTAQVQAMSANNSNFNLQTQNFAPPNTHIASGFNFPSHYADPNMNNAQQFQQQHQHVLQAQVGGVLPPHLRQNALYYQHHAPTIHYVTNPNQIHPQPQGTMYSSAHPSAPPSAFSIPNNTSNIDKNGPKKDFNGWPHHRFLQHRLKAQRRDIVKWKKRLKRKSIHSFEGHLKNKEAAIIRNNIQFPRRIMTNYEHSLPFESYLRKAPTTHQKQLIYQQNVAYNAGIIPITQHHIKEQERSLEQAIAESTRSPTSSLRIMSLNIQSIGTDMMKKKKVKKLCHISEMFKDKRL